MDPIRQDGIPLMICGEDTTQEEQSESLLRPENSDRLRCLLDGVMDLMNLPRPRTNVRRQHQRPPQSQPQPPRSPQQLPPPPPPPPPPPQTQPPAPQRPPPPPRSPPGFFSKDKPTRTVNGHTLTSNRDPLGLAKNSNNPFYVFDICESNKILLQSMGLDNKPTDNNHVMAKNQPGRSSDAAGQTKPRDSVQTKPSTTAPAKPQHSLQRKPSTAAPAKPQHSVQTKPSTDAPAKPQHSVQTKPSTAAPAKPQHSVQREPSTAAPAKPQYSVQTKSSTAAKTSSSGKPTTGNDPAQRSITSDKMHPPRLSTNGTKTQQRHPVKSDVTSADKQRETSNTTVATCFTLGQFSNNISRPTKKTTTSHPGPAPKHTPIPHSGVRPKELVHSSPQSGFDIDYHLFGTPEKQPPTPTLARTSKSIPTEIMSRDTNNAATLKTPMDKPHTLSSPEGQLHHQKQKTATQGNNEDVKTVRALSWEENFRKSFIGCDDTQGIRAPWRKSMTTVSHKVAKPATTKRQRWNPTDCVSEHQGQNQHLKQQTVIQGNKEDVLSWEENSKKAFLGCNDTQGVRAPWSKSVSPVSRKLTKPLNTKRQRSDPTDCVSQQPRKKQKTVTQDNLEDEKTLTVLPWEENFRKSILGYNDTQGVRDPRRKFMPEVSPLKQINPVVVDRNKIRSLVRGDCS